MASTYLSKTLSGSPTDNNKWTWSAWVKRAKLGSGQVLFYADDGSANYATFIRFRDTDQLDFSNQWSASNDSVLLTNRRFRDTSAFYHIQVVLDTSNSTAADRQIVYVNGVRETSFATETTATSGKGSTINDGYEHRIGRGNNSFGSDYFDGNMTHIHFADGQAYAPTVFGETDSTSGIWKPKTAPSVTYGTNGFFLKFENSGAMGTDSSGNSNTFTVSGTLTQNVDTPSNNFATINTLQGAIASGLTLINGNLTIDGNTGTAWRSLPATLGVSTGKWYYEVKVKNLADNVRIGLVDVDQAQQLNGYFNNLSRGYAYNNSGEKSNNNSSASYGNSYTTNDIIGIAMDLDNSKLYFSKNGVFQNSGDPTSGSTGTGSAYDISSSYTYAPCVATYQPTDKLECNFGQGYFGTTAVSSANADDGGLGIMEYDVPANYRVLCTKNIKDYG
jgi:hypothetical protein